MRRILQIRDGVVVGEWTGSGDVPVPPDETWTFVDVTFNPTPKVGDHYDPVTKTFTTPAYVNTILSHADVIGLLSATEWAEMNKYSPTAAPPYDDADVFHAVSVFNKAHYIDLSDERTAGILAMLITKNIVTVERAAELQSQMAALAASRS